MLKPQQRSEVLLHDAPPVFGKPWYWPRSSGSTMESTRSLAHVIMEMRDEIKKLESENRALRGGTAQHIAGAVPGERILAAQQTGKVENPYVNLRRNASAPSLEGQYKENAVMTVRRYSVASPLSGVSREGKPDMTRRNESGWVKLKGEVHGNGTGVFDNSDRFDLGHISNRHSLHEYVDKNRAKVKTVTFLLPVDDIYTNRPVLTKHQDDDHKSTELESITETDS